MVWSGNSKSDQNLFPIIPAISQVFGPYYEGFFRVEQFGRSLESFYSYRRVWKLVLMWSEQVGSGQVVFYIIASPSPDAAASGSASGVMCQPGKAESESSSTAPLVTLSKTITSWPDRKCTSSRSRCAQGAEIKPRASVEAWMPGCYAPWHLELFKSITIKKLWFAADETWAIRTIYFESWRSGKSAAIRWSDTTMAIHLMISIKRDVPIRGDWDAVGVDSANGSTTVSQGMSRSEAGIITANRKLLPLKIAKKLT